MNNHPLNTERANPNAFDPPPYSNRFYRLKILDRVEKCRNEKQKRDASLQEAKEKYEREKQELNQKRINQLKEFRQKNAKNNLKFI